MSKEEKSPEDWEAGEIIDDLKSGLPKPGQELTGVCAYHASLVRGMIWQIRHSERRGNGVAMPVGVSGGVAAMVIVIAEIFKKHFGV